jgi:hypothetical protein
MKHLARAAAITLTGLCVSQVVYTSFDPILETEATRYVKYASLMQRNGLPNALELSLEASQSPAGMQQHVILASSQNSCMYRRWTCGKCSGINDTLYQQISRTECHIIDGRSTAWCDGERFSTDLVKAVREGDCRWTCSSARQPLLCDEEALIYSGGVLWMKKASYQHLFLICYACVPCQLRRPSFTDPVGKSRYG